MVDSTAMRAAASTAILVLAAGLGGCLERDITVTSEPPGAIVYLNGVDIGRTPVTTPFKWHGDYDVVLELPGYRTLHTHANINVPPQEVVPVDLFADLSPHRYEDHRYLHYEMEELVLPDANQLIERAEQLRERNVQPPK
jgi:hypothetical protein